MATFYKLIGGKKVTTRITDGAGRTIWEASSGKPPPAQRNPNPAPIKPVGVIGTAISGVASYIQASRTGTAGVPAYNEVASSSVASFGLGGLAGRMADKNPLATQRAAERATRVLADTVAANEVNMSPVPAAGPLAIGSLSGTFSKLLGDFVKEHPLIATGAAAVAGAGVGALTAKVLSDGSVVLVRKRRRIDPGNTSALRRSLSRVRSFNNLTHSVRKTMRKAMPKGG